MRHSTVSAPIESCNVLSLNSPTLRFCALHLLSGQILYFIVEPKSKTKELYNQACAHFASQGMLETDLFGLSVILDGEYLFVDPDYKLSKYAPKNWRSSSTHGLNNAGQPLLVFYFRVQFYVDSPLLLRDEISRHYYYLQLRQNVAHRSMVNTYMAEEIVYFLVGLALQADFGDYSESKHSGNYFVLQEYFPQQMVMQGHDMRFYQNAILVHKANRSLTKAQAEAQFIREASSRDSFTLAHNSHLYRLKQKKRDPDPGTLWLAICTKGIELYEEKSNKPINGTFMWNDIGKLCFDRKKFEIRSLNPSGERMIYYTNSDEKSKHLLTLCKLTHQFCMAIQPRLNELTRKEEEERKQCREWGNELNVKLTELRYNHNTDQRISVISTTSSNTTSGIVSDRVHSLDESEDDLDMEIMINSPPAISVESLALAHLRDSFMKESRKIKKNAHSSSPTYRSSNEMQDEASETCFGKRTLSPTPALTDGSQCSSSCSTVVVTSYSHEKIQSQRSELSVKASNRSHSTTSSLELGYSHTAQNSTLSDAASCYLELDCSVQSAHTSSGIYTLKSSCETNTVATTAIAASSETSGIGQSIVEDSEGIRSRSGSIVSASGSFHGDGSDPSDTGHGTPLTADELSDLIVGRSPKPCRGKYPSVATVSESLDSVADYVTLPPPPVPPHGRITFKSIEPLILRENAPVTFSSKSSDSSSYLARQGSVSNLSQLSNNRKYHNEEALLQRQIQFQHLAAGFSSQLLLNTLPNTLIPSAKTRLRSTTDLAALNGSYAITNSTAGYSLSQSKQKQNHKSCISLPLRSEETVDRIISTKPQINVFKTHSTYMPSTSVVTSYASSAGLGYNLQTYRSQKMNQPISYPEVAESSLRNDYCVNTVPIVGSNNYLDVRKSGAAFLQHIHEKFPPPPPPLLYNRQPPPPPPPLPPPRNQHSLYNGNLLSHQFDQYRQQLYSDVDYVIYPIKDPAISKQEYLDSKEASGHCNQYLSQTSLNSKMTSPYHVLPPVSCSMYGRKSHALYRSTPNVAIAGSCVPASYYQQPNMRYASNQNLTAELSGCSNSSLVYLSSLYSSSTSPLHSAATSMHSSSMQSLRHDSSVYGRILSGSSNCSFARARSDDNILNCSNGRRTNSDLKFRKPPPPPPPPYSSQKNSACLSECINSSQLYKITTYPYESPAPISANEDTKVDAAASEDKNTSLDICSLREKSKNLDLPLISALCNDKSLLKQTNTIDSCKKQSDSQWCHSRYNNSNRRETQHNVNELESVSTTYSLNTAPDVYTHTRSTGVMKSLVASKSVSDLGDLKIASSSTNFEKTSFISKLNIRKLGLSSDRSKFMTNNVQSTSFVDPSKSKLSADTVSSGAKIKSINSKLTKSSSSINKLKYPVSQPVQQSARTSTVSIENKNSILKKVKCKSSKIKSSDVGTQTSKPKDVNN